MTSTFFSTRVVSFLISLIEIETKAVYICKNDKSSVENRVNV